jgi:hypothetical protein
MALADHLSERDEHDGRAGKEEAGAPDPDAAVQISVSPTGIPPYRTPSNPVGYHQDTLS